MISMSVQKIRNLGGKTTATSPLPTLQTSMHNGSTHSLSNETGATPSLYASMHLGTSPDKSKQSPTQKVIDTMRSSGGKK